MGTQPIPESTSKEPSTVVDQPRIGAAMWLLLACFLIPPSVVTLVGNMVGTIPNQRLWIVLLGIPIPIMLFSLPRRYTLDADGLTITGLFYRLKVPRAQILSVKRVGVGRALIYPGSMFCSDPNRALLIERSGKMNLVISPRQTDPFLALDPARTGSGPSGDRDQTPEQGV